jgi:hypothetical protein
MQPFGSQTIKGPLIENPPYNLAQTAWTFTFAYHNLQLGLYQKYALLTIKSGGKIESKLSPIPPNLSLNFLVPVFPSNNNV